MNLTFSLNRVADVLRRQSDLAGSRRTYAKLFRSTASSPPTTPAKPISLTLQSRLGDFGRAAEPDE